MISETMAAIDTVLAAILGTAFGWFLSESLMGSSKSKICPPCGVNHHAGCYNLVGVGSSCNCKCPVIYSH